MMEEKEMSLLMLIGMLLVYFAISIFEETGKRVKPFTKGELDDIGKKIRGKSPAEQRRILKNYKGISKK